MSCVSTLLFVDVDGVLNVGIADTSGAPLALDAGNVAFARKMVKRLDRFSESDRAIAERTIATCDRKLGQGEDSTYEKFALDKSIGVSQVLVERLAIIIRAMKGRGAVILSSSWRNPKHAKRVAKLEAAISCKLGAPFKFDGTTEVCDDNTPGLRLKAIGDYVSFYAEHHVSEDNLQVLVLDDFFAEEMGQHGRWVCDDTAVASIREAEQYLEQRAPSHQIAARVIHTRDAFTTPGGLHAEIGCGVTLQHLQRALQFLQKQPFQKGKQLKKSIAHCAYPAWDHDALPFYPWTCHFDTNQQAAWPQFGQPLTQCMTPLTTVGCR